MGAATNFTTSHRCSPALMPNRSFPTAQAYWAPVHPFIPSHLRPCGRRVQSVGHTGHPPKRGGLKEGKRDYGFLL